MSLLIVDEEKCKKDRICAGECPMAIIQLPDDDFPRLVEGGEGICISCGHCVVVCPHGALSHARVPLDECPPIQKDLKINEEEAVQFLRSRRSVRFFKDQPVERETIQKLIDIARYAPTGSNSQTVEWIVHTDRDKIKDISGMVIEWMKAELEKSPDVFSAPYMPIVVAAWDFGFDAVLRNAPALITASAPGDSSNGMVDLTLAFSYLELAAVTMGIGTCWAGILQGALLNHPPLREAIGIPEGHVHHYPMMAGYSKVKYHRLPQRKPPVINWK